MACCSALYTSSFFVCCYYIITSIRCNSLHFRRSFKIDKSKKYAYFQANWSLGKVALYKIASRTHLEISVVFGLISERSWRGAFAGKGIPRARANPPRGKHSGPRPVRRRGYSAGLSRLELHQRTAECRRRVLRARLPQSSNRS